MKTEITTRDIIEVTKGEIINEKQGIKFENFSKDTREIKKDDIYVGIKGSTYNGNLFWKEALNLGAQAVIIDEDTKITEEEIQKYKEKTIIKVKDTIKAIQEIATYKRNLYNIPIIGITGSVGKTSTRDLIASVLSQKYKTLSTVGNQNNDIGLPFTILKLKNHEVAVIEMGMNQLGQISCLTKIAKPTISVITSIGTSHIGDLKSRENILKAKLEILEGMKEKNLIINNDNDLLHEWYEKNKKEYNIITYGIENSSNVEASEIREYEEYSEFICKIKKCHENNCTEEEKIKVKIPISGKHFVYNTMCAVIIGKQLGLTNEEIIKGIEETNLTQKRMQIIKLKENITIINDSYNASCEAMKAAIEYLGGRDNRKRKIAVLGDMFDLGEYSEDLHRKVGKEIVKNKIDILICSGNQTKYIIDEAIKHGMKQETIYYEPNNEAVKNRIKEIMKSDDEILVKASNGMKFFNIVEEITKEG